MIRPSIKSSLLETRKRESLTGFDGLGRGKKWGLLFVSWTLFGLFFASQVLISRAYRGRPLNFGHTLSIWLICAYIWACLTPLILYFSRRFRIERGRLRNLLIHLVASLSALKMQLHPHFLFNTLNSIAVLVRKNSNKEAVNMLSGLGDLLRHSLENIDTQEVPLKDELEVLKL